MLTTRIIPCLDVKDGKVVKGVKFRDHRYVGEIVDLARIYADQGADELVFYDITASCESKSVDTDWVGQVSKVIDIPFCVAGGIRNLATAKRIFELGADKISINTPAIDNPSLITKLSEQFGRQAVVIGIDSIQVGSEYYVCKNTGSKKSLKQTQTRTIEWVKTVELLGAGEIVLNCMDQDGVRNGYDLKQLNIVREATDLPLVASGGAGCAQDFLDAIQISQVEACLAASVFHSGNLSIPELKSFLNNNGAKVRLC